MRSRANRGSERRDVKLIVGPETKMQKLQELHNCCSEQPMGPNCEIHPCTGAQGVWGDHHKQSERPQHLWNPSNPSHRGGLEGDLAKDRPNTWPEDSHLLRRASRSYPRLGRGSGRGGKPFNPRTVAQCFPSTWHRTRWMDDSNPCRDRSSLIPRAHGLG